MKQTINVRLALGALAAFTAISTPAFANCGADLSTQFHVRLGRQYTSGGVVHQTADITNLGSTRKGPLYFVVDNMPAGVSESPFTYTSNCEPGAEFIRIYLGYSNQFDSGTSKTLSLNFWNAQLPVNYNYRVIDGSNFQNPRFVPGDFDGDGMADLATRSNSTGFWTIRLSTNSQVETLQYGAPGNDRTVVGDFDGDLKQDVAFYRVSVGAFFIWRSSDNQVMGFQLGVPNVDIPVPADYDGDGYTDPAVYNPNTGVWQVLQSTNGQLVKKQFGSVGDKPVIADYDGDGKADFAIFRPVLHMFIVLKSHTNQLVTFATPEFQGGIPFSVDFDGDGRSDMCTYNLATGQVAIAYASGGAVHTVSMGGNAVPVAADFGGDHEADFATFDKPSAHWVIDSQMNALNPVPVLLTQFGTPPDDIPVMTIPAYLW
jgi:hypothetical protein